MLRRLGIIQCLRSSALAMLMAGCLFAASFALASRGVPDGWESYETRPDILDVESKGHDLGSDWGRLKDAHFSFLAEMLALYPPETEFYFLARDSEHLYDVARLVTEGTPIQKRMHLLNVSRGNMDSPLLKDYLGANGISEESLAKGKKVVFVDTGFAGTIPRNIAEKFSSELGSKLKTHLLVSSNPNHPSSRVFLSHLNPAINEQVPGQMHGTIVNYEHMPRYTDRSSQYVEVNGKPVPISPITGSADGSVSKAVSLHHMQDLRAEWSKPERRQQFKEELELYRKIREALTANESAKEKSLSFLSEKNPEKRGRIEAFVRDAIEAEKNGALDVKVSLGDLSLPEVVAGASSVSKKNVLINKYPEWKPVLENPDKEIPDLFKKKDWQMIGNLIDANVDFEINDILAKSLYNTPATGIKGALQRLMIEKGDAQTLAQLVQSSFSHPHAAEMKDLVRLLIEKGDSVVLQLLAKYTFSQQETAEMKDLVRLLVEKGDVKVLESLSRFTFSEPHTADMKDLIRVLVEEGDPGVLRNLAKYTFSQPHTAGMKDLVRLLIEKGDAFVLQDLAAYTFSQPHTAEMKDLVRLLIEKGDARVLQVLPYYMSDASHFKGSSEYDVFLEAISIADTSARKAFLAKHLPPSDQGKAKVKISPSLKAGDEVEIEKKSYVVVSRAGEGKRGIVYELKGPNKEKVALKVAKSLDEATLESLRKEKEKTFKWAKVGISTAGVLATGDDFVLKEWVSGVRGDQVVAAALKGDTKYYPAMEALHELIVSLQKQGIHVGDFRPPNLMWNGKQWVLIDGGSVKEGLSVSDVVARWREKFPRRWGLPVPDVTGPDCQAWFKSFSVSQ